MVFQLFLFPYVAVTLLHSLYVVHQHFLVLPLFAGGELDRGQAVEQHICLDTTKGLTSTINFLLIKPIVNFNGQMFF